MTKSPRCWGYSSQCIVYLAHLLVLSWHNSMQWLSSRYAPLTILSKIHLRYFSLQTSKAYQSGCCDCPGARAKIQVLEYENHCSSLPINVCEWKPDLTADCALIERDIWTQNWHKRLWIWCTNRFFVMWNIRLSIAYIIVASSSRYVGYNSHQSADHVKTRIRVCICRYSRRLTYVLSHEVVAIKTQGWLDWIVGCPWTYLQVTVSDKPLRLNALLASIASEWLKVLSWRCGSGSKR